MKSPRIQHSKPPRKPVTIDLGKDDVTRMADEPAAAAPDDGKVAAAPAKADEKPASEETLATAAAATGGRAHDAPDPAPDPEKAAPKPATASRLQAASGKPADDTAKAPPPPPAGGGGFGRALAAGLVGGLVVLAAGAGAHFAGLLPARIDEMASAQTDALQGEIEALKASVAALPPAQPAPEAPDLTPLEQRIAALESELPSLRDTAGTMAAPDLGNIEERLAALEETARSLSQAPDMPDLEPLRAEQAALSQIVARLDASVAQAGTHGNETDMRLGDLASRLTTLEQQVSEQEERPGMALAIAASALKSAIDRGTPFMTELETYASVTPDAPEIAQLRDMAASGVPTRAAIEAELPAAATAMIAAGQQVAAPDAGLVDRLMSSARSLVTVRPVGMVEGSDTASVVARLEAHVRAGDYAAALGEYEALPPEAKAAGGGLMDKVRARQAADELTATALAAALRSGRP